MWRNIESILDLHIREIAETVLLTASHWKQHTFVEGYVSVYFIFIFKTQKAYLGVPWLPSGRDSRLSLQ